MKKAAALAAFCLTLCGCSIENEEAEKPAPQPEAVQEERFDDPLMQDFAQRARHCILGRTELAPDLYDEAIKSRSDPAFKEPYALQDPRLVLLLEACLRKADLESGGSLFEKSLPDAEECARISREFYAKGRLSEGAFWLRQVCNFKGLSAGYELAGAVFCEDPRTISQGAALLAFAARQGSRSARLKLLNLASGRR
ncbi:MAG: hypothetical protein SPL30_01910 [Succinivibrio sp.]|nr:hypothetical protein [Succinivibrio sp.]